MPASLIVATLAGALLGQDPEPGNDRATAERVEFMIDSARVYELARTGTSEERLSLHAKPLLRWNNPVSGVRDGIIALWTAPDGRPEVVAQIFLTRDAVWMHEFQSLSEQPLEMTRSGRRVWAPAEGGVKMKPVPGAPPPAAGRPARLTQMGLLARQFTASVDFKVDFRDEQTSRYELRLLPRALHRYGDENSRLFDGALFTFVQGTNPEVFLLLEARQTDDGPRWHYGLAPMTGYATQAKHTSGAAWESENMQKYRGRTDMAYLVTRFES